MPWMRRVEQRHMRWAGRVVFIPHDAENQVMALCSAWPVASDEAADAADAHVAAVLPTKLSDLRELHKLSSIPPSLHPSHPFVSFRCNVILPQLEEMKRQ